MKDFTDEEVNKIFNTTIKLRLLNDEYNKNDVSVSIMEDRCESLYGYSLPETNLNNVNKAKQAFFDMIYRAYKHLFSDPRWEETQLQNKINVADANEKAHLLGRVDEFNNMTKEFDEFLKVKHKDLWTSYHNKLNK